MELEKVIATLTEIVPEFQPEHRLLTQNPKMVRLAVVRDAGTGSGGH